MASSTGWETISLLVLLSVYKRILSKENMLNEGPWARGGTLMNTSV